MRSTFSDLPCIALLASACTGVAPDSTDISIDVSDQLCAGLLDLDGSTAVPTHSTNDCTGAEVSGVLSCPDCEVAPGQEIELAWDFVEESRSVTCVRAPLDTNGEFALGMVAPSNYVIWFSGSLATGGTGSAGIFFDVCSEPVFLEGEVRKDIYY